MRTTLVPLLMGLATLGCRQPSTDASATSSALPVTQAAPAASGSSAARSGDRPIPDRGLPRGVFTSVLIDPADPSHLVAAGAAAGGVWHIRGAGSPGWHRANPQGAVYAKQRTMRLLPSEHPTEGPSLVVQVETVSHAPAHALHRVAWSQLVAGPAKQLDLLGQPLALATDPHPGRRGRIAAVILGGDQSGSPAGSLAISSDAGDHFRRVHPGGRCHLARALAFGSDGHLWMVSLGSVPGSKVSPANIARLTETVHALAAGPLPSAAPPGLGLLSEPALLAINPERGAVTERLALPMPAHLITVDPDLKGTAWLGGRQGLMRLHGGRVRAVPLRTTAGERLEPPLELAGITVFRAPEAEQERLFVALTGSPAQRGLWLGQQLEGQWRFQRVSEDAGPSFPDLPVGPVAVDAAHALVVAPYGSHGIRRSEALGQAGSWAAVH